MYFDLLRNHHYFDKYLELLHKYKLVQKPIFVDYYLVDLQQSIIAKEMQGVTYDFLKFGAVKYKLVKNYPLSNFTSYTRSTTGNEGGVYNDTELECLFVQMDDVKFIPSTLDFIVINYSINEERFKKYTPIFRVANVETLPIQYSMTFYKLKLTFSGKYFEMVKNDINSKLTGVYYFDEISKKVYEKKDYEILISSIEKCVEITNTLNEALLENYIGYFGISGLKY